MANGFGRNYPKGRISGEDEGETAIGMAVDKETNRLIINFFKPVVWIGLDRDSAIQVLMTLAKNVSQLIGVPVSVTIDDNDTPPHFAWSLVAKIGDYVRYENLISAGGKFYERDGKSFCDLVDQTYELTSDGYQRIE